MRKSTLLLCACAVPAAVAAVGPRLGELRGSLDDRPWLRIASSEGEAAVAVNRCHRSISSRRRSRDGRETTVTYRYEVSAAIAIGVPIGIIVPAQDAN